MVGAWIFDEAHCLSEWRNDFRPDYLYASRFIREYTGIRPLAPIGCFTATAKPAVQEQIQKHFKKNLGIGFDVFVGSPERENLSFEVHPCTQDEKWPCVHALLTEGMKEARGGAVVFVSIRKHAEVLADFLTDQNWGPASTSMPGFNPMRKRYSG